MPIIKQILRLANTLGDLPPLQRRTACCQNLGAHKHGFFQRYPPERNCPSLPFMIFIQRFLCLFCGQTFSILPFFFIRRIAISLPDLLALMVSRLSGGKLMKALDISRNTLKRWKKTGNSFLKALPEIVGQEKLTWRVLSHFLSRLQYPRFRS